MKVYIAVDLEGISGIVLQEQVWGTASINQGNTEYEYARRLFTKEANAAVEGALEGGADEILVNDGHRFGFNFIAEKLHEEAQYVMGTSRPSNLYGLDETCDAMFMIGYHAMAGAKNGVLDHTYWPDGISAIYLNGRLMGEVGLQASVAGHFGVPVVLVTGDVSVTEEARSVLGDVETVSVKRGVSRHCAVCLHPAKARRLIKEAAKRALLRIDEFKPLVTQSPVELRVEYVQTTAADEKARITGVERINPLTVQHRGKDILTVMRTLGFT